MITRVRKLTAMNISALDNTMLASELGVTYADFEGSPVQARDAVEKMMASLPMGSTYRSLRAVRRKLSLAASRWDAVKRGEEKELALTPFVTSLR
jgi:hypothetical protein